MNYIFFAAIFLSAGLLFVIQPMLAKAFLPYLGGSPSVWIVSMLFFQTLLLLGYGYAALSSAFLTPKRQILFHIVLNLIAILLFLPIQVLEISSVDLANPEFSLISLLFLTIGLPYFLLTSNSSIIQRCYYITSTKTPYYLFSISNAGSLIGLLSYPFVIEWLLPLDKQMSLWAIGFILLNLLLVAIAYKIFKVKNFQKNKASLGVAIPVSKGLRICFFGFLPSSLFLGLTFYMTSDFTPFPLIWVIPLSLYLISFIIVFSKNSEKYIASAQKLHVPAVAFSIMLMLLVVDIKLAFLHLLFFLVIAVSCHGQAAREKPKPEALTSYYFWLSLGGALGGLFNTIAPYIFNDAYEYIIVAVFSIFVFPEIKSLPKEMQARYKKILLPSALCMAVVCFYFFNPSNLGYMGDEKVLFKERNFFGISKVVEVDTVNKYMHGSTLHGFQNINKDKLSVNSYYVPIKSFLEKLPINFYDKPFGILGLGIGTTACLGKSNQVIDFFEIDPIVMEIAQNPKFFTYVTSCPSHVNINLGDGRIELGKKKNSRYNLLIMDAFTSDSIPTHLVSLEAVKTYKDKLDSKNGVLLFNISNRYIDISGVLARVASELDLVPYQSTNVGNTMSSDELKSHWIIMLPKDSPWKHYVLASGATEISFSNKSQLWTDNYSQLISVLKVFKS